MDFLLKLFWNWLGASAEEYAKNFSKNYEEFMFPHWDKLITETKNVISTEEESQIYNILTMMAIDNEEETILEYISDNSSAAFVDLLIQVIPQHIQPHARWQGAELIRRRLTAHGPVILKQLSQDENDYVVKRAKNAYAEFVTE